MESDCFNCACFWLSSHEASHLPWTPASNVPSNDPSVSTTVLRGALPSIAPEILRFLRCQSHLALVGRENNVFLPPRARHSPMSQSQNHRSHRHKLRHHRRGSHRCLYLGLRNRHALCQRCLQQRLCFLRISRVRGTQALEPQSNPVLNPIRVRRSRLRLRNGHLQHFHQRNIQHQLRPFQAFKT